MSLINKICCDIGLCEREFEEYAKSAANHIKKTSIRKKNGGKRSITIPSWNLKIIQYWTTINYLRKLPNSRFSTAYHKGASILKNASKHVDGNYFIKLDIKSFFTSITSEMFIESLQKDYQKDPHNIVLKELLDATQNIHFLNSLFYKNICVIGFPSSPYIANYILKNFDEKVFEKLENESEKIGKFSFTRYADDIFISCEKKGNRKLIYNIIKTTLANEFNGKLELNEEKTKKTTKKGGSTIITGILICSDGRITLPRKYKDHIRLIFSLYKKGKLTKETPVSLIGHLNYIKSVDPIFYNKIYEKYYAEIKDF